MLRHLIERIIESDMPGESFQGDQPELSVQEIAVRDAIQEHVRNLAETIGIRNTYHYAAYARAGEYINSRFAAMGYKVMAQEYNSHGRIVRNLEAILPGRTPSPELVVGAHYDTVDCPGANDNASGVAALLEIARMACGMRPDRTVRFVAFANEEPPHYRTSEMGSLVYARSLRARNLDLLGMICLETIGYYSEEANSQAIPYILEGLYTNTRGNFIGFFSNRASADFLKKIVGTFRETTPFPSEGLAAPSLVPGIDFSDHWSFWQMGYKALMVTDTAFLRYAHYHAVTDTWEKLCYDPLARVTVGLARTILELARRL
jgi:Zn-dependent M28 family amino/carboxypeptidase